MANLLTVLDAAGDSSPLVLAQTGDTIASLRVNGRQLVQDAPGIRATHSAMYGRGNVSNQIALAITYAPSTSAQAAKEKAATLDAAIAAKLGTATIMEIVFGTRTFRLGDAALADWELDADRGTTLVGQFTFTGGAFAALP